MKLRQLNKNMVEVEERKDGVKKMLVTDIVMIMMMPWMLDFPMLTNISDLTTKAGIWYGSPAICFHNGWRVK